MVVEIFEALVFVLSTLEIDPRLLQFLVPQSRSRLCIHRSSSVRFAGCSIDGVPVVRRVKVRQELALSHLLTLFNIDMKYSAAHLECC